MGQGPVFKPERVQRCESDDALRAGAGADNRDGRVYVYNDPKLTLAVNVAWATERPLLLSGASGSGKSSLAANVARTLGWRYYEHVVTSRTEARDFLYRFDSIRRLNDAQAKELKEVWAYVEPGVLWWAFDPVSAADRGSRGKLPVADRATDPNKLGGHERAVLLIDEIDKADADVPNGLLVPLGSLQFKVDDVNFTVETRHPPLVIITTNGERELPQAFIRRCVTLELPDPDVKKLVEIATAVIPESKPIKRMLHSIAHYVLGQGQQELNGLGTKPSTAEYLDTVRACLELNITPASASFKDLARITLRKKQKVQGVAP
jgi:MoxR-like ATPase